MPCTAFIFPASGERGNCLFPEKPGIYNGIMNKLQFALAQIRAIKQRDPSLKSTVEILFFPGFRALNTWYTSHKLYLKGHYALARFLSLRAQQKTGIDIHPGAQIGSDFFIDHGSGVVIGETCIIGDHVTLYQGVTLGATGKTTGNRHPVLQNNVVIGAGAKIIGRITNGHDARIGAGSVIIRDDPPYTTMVPAAAHPVRYRNHKLPVLTLEGLSDRIDDEIRHIRFSEDRLERKLRCLERRKRSVSSQEPERLRH